MLVTVLVRMAPLVYRPLVPWDVLPGDANSGDWFWLMPMGMWLPHPLRVLAMLHGWCGELDHIHRPVSLISPLGGFYSCFMTDDSGGPIPSFVAALGCLWWDIKQFRGGLVWRPCPPVGRDHLANVGHSGPLQF